MKTIEGRENIKRRSPDLLSDESGVRFGIPANAFFPENLGDIIDIVKAVKESGGCLRISGGRTGITGGCVPDNDETVISLEKMNRILEFEEKEDGSKILRCQPGVTIEEINSFLVNPGDYSRDVINSEKIKPGSLIYPPDPTELTAQLGGSAATNASGARTFRYGPTRKHISELTVVLPDGNTLSLKRGEYQNIEKGAEINISKERILSLPEISFRSPELKNNAGFYIKDNSDLLDIFIGSEGILCIIAEIGICLSESRETIAGMSFFRDRQSAFGFSDFLRNEDIVQAIEFFDDTSISFLEKHRKPQSLSIPEVPGGMNNAVYWEAAFDNMDEFEQRFEEWESRLQENGSSMDNTWSGFEKDEKKKLKDFRHAVPELINQKIRKAQSSFEQIRKISTDCAIPRSGFRDFFNRSVELIEASGLETVIFGHIGDYHLHINLVPSDRDEYNRALRLYDKIISTALSLNGTFSAEHGTGRLKTAYLKLMFNENELRDMRRIKEAFDPGYRLNRNNMFTYSE